MMRRTIPLVVAVTLMLAMAASPANAFPKSYPQWDTWCDMDGNGSLETHLTQVASFKPGWTIEPLGVKAPVVWFGGHVQVYVNGVLDPSLTAHVASPPGLDGKLTTCTQEATYQRGADIWTVVWDPVYGLFSPPATP